ncbi:hypothetical protein LTS18_010775, partial [Coniosporium uncinatum]
GQQHVSPSSRVHKWLGSYASGSLPSERDDSVGKESEARGSAVPMNLDGRMKSVGSTGSEAPLSPRSMKTEGELEKIWEVV